MKVEQIIKQLVKTHGKKEIAYQGGVSYNSMSRYCYPNSFISVKVLERLRDAGLITFEIKIKETE